MRWTSRALIVCGIADLLLAAACILSYAMAHGSQYGGFVVWITRLQGVETGQAGYEDTRSRVLDMLSRTSWPVLIAHLALGVTGVVCLIAGFWMKSRAATGGR